METRWSWEANNSLFYGIIRKKQQTLASNPTFWTAFSCRANSVTWNPHKMMSVPLQCSALLVREEVRMDLSELFPGLDAWNNRFPDLTPQGLMQNCNQMHACYLFQQDKQYDLSYDTGDKALQCGRHVDIFKLWLMWRAKVEAVQGFLHNTKP